MAKPLDLTSALRDADLDDPFVVLWLESALKEDAKYGRLMATLGAPNLRAMQKLVTEAEVPNGEGGDGRDLGEGGMDKRSSPLKIEGGMKPAILKILMESKKPMSSDDINDYIEDKYGKRASKGSVQNATRELTNEGKIKLANLRKKGRTKYYKIA